MDGASKRDDVVSGSLYEVRQLQNGRTDDYDQVGVRWNEAVITFSLSQPVFPLDSHVSRNTMLGWKQPKR